MSSLPARNPVPVRSPLPVLNPRPWRPPGPGNLLAEHLAAAGVDLLEHPVVEIHPVPAAELTGTLAALAAGEYAHLVLTSARTIDALLAPRGPDGESLLRIPSSTRVAAVGRTTAETAREHGIPVDLEAAGSGQDLVDRFPPAVPGHEAVLLPASEAAAPTVADGLGAHGYRVDRVTAYRPVPVPLPERVAEELRRGGFSAVVLTSSMIARLIAASGVHRSTAVVVIGEPTDRAAHAAGLTVAARSADPGERALADAVLTSVGPGSPAEPTEPTEPNSSVGPAETDDLHDPEETS